MSFSLPGGDEVKVGLTFEGGWDNVVGVNIPLTFRSTGVRMSKYHRFALCLAWWFIISLCAAASAGAQSAQAYVSARNGVDAGNCTNASPCRTVSYAITQVQHFGQVLIVDSGDYDSSVQIDRSVTVAAAPGVIAVFSAAINLGAIFLISSGPALCTRAGVCHTVVLRNLTFDGQIVTQARGWHGRDEPDRGGSSI